jgi:PAS domain S-box-containing protein
MPPQDHPAAEESGTATRLNGEGRAAAGTELGSGDLNFDRFLELVPDAMVVVDPSGRIVSLNRQAEELFGYTREELLREQVERLVPGRFADALGEHRSGYFDNPQSRPLGLGPGFSGKRKDGSEFPAGISLSAIETAGGTVTAAAVRDLTAAAEAEKERTELEAEASEARAHQARRLESIGELAGGIAHDFNNLLAVILNNAELALHKGDKRSGWSEELREIQGAAEHGAKLTRQLLVFGRRQVISREPVDLNAVVTGMERILHGSIGETIHLEIKLAENLPPVLADASQMEQVILNLAINARHAMPSGGKLGIATKVVELDEEYARTRPDVTPGHYVQLTVADDGAGMPRDVVSRAFEPFFTTKAKGEGTGMGLSTIYGIVKQCDGHVNIYSEEGHGTVIRVDLPVAGGETDLDEAPVDDVATPPPGQKILVVEDNDPVRRTVCEILQVNGYEVVEADGGKPALELVQDGGFDLVLTDVVMPEMLGTELADELRESHPGLPLLFMSGYADVAGPIEDPSMLIEKPFTSAKLLAKVQEAIALETGTR